MHSVKIDLDVWILQEQAKRADKITIEYLSRPPDKIVYWKLFSLFLIQNLRCGYSKEPSQWDGSFEHPKHMFK